MSGRGWLHVDELDDRSDGTGPGTFSDDEARQTPWPDPEPEDDRPDAADLAGLGTWLYTRHVQP